MRDLPPEIQDRIEALCDAGEAAMADGDFDFAVTKFQEAWAILPEPRCGWDCAVSILAAIGDAHFSHRNFAQCKNIGDADFRDRVGSPDNPLIRLRLGQCLFEVGDEHEAADWLVGAYAAPSEKNSAHSLDKFPALVPSPRPRHAERHGRCTRPDRIETPLVAVLDAHHARGREHDVCGLSRLGRSW